MLERLYVRELTRIGVVNLYRRSLERQYRDTKYQVITDAIRSITRGAATTYYIIAPSTQDTQWITRRRRLRAAKECIAEMLYACRVVEYEVVVRR